MLPASYPPNSSRCCSNFQLERVMPAASKTKMLETPKAKAQGGEIDYKAKIDAAMEAFTSKVTRGPVPLHPVHCSLHQLPEWP